VDVSRRNVATTGSYHGQVFTRAVPLTMASFKPVAEPAVHPSKPLLIITVGTARAQSILALTMPAMQAYAARVGADFIALTNQTQSWPLAEKFRVAHYAKAYQRTLFVDADVLIRSTAPDIFKAVHPRRIGIYDDTPGLLSGLGGLDWIAIEMEAIRESQGWKPLNTASCLNSGVVLTSGKDSDIWSPPESPFPLTHCAEQHIVQCRVMERPIQRLDAAWNYQWREHRDFAGIEHAHFVHLAGLSQANPEITPALIRALTLIP
jgi:hypothetical protein